MQNSQRRIGSVNDIDPVNGYYSSAAQEQQFLLQQQQYLEHQRLQQLAQQEEFKRQQHQSQPQYNNQQQQSQPKSMSKVVSRGSHQVWRNLFLFRFSESTELFTITKRKIPMKSVLQRATWSLK